MVRLAQWVLLYDDLRFYGTRSETGKKAVPHTFNHSYSEPVWQRDSTSCMPLLDEDAGVIYINGIRGIYAFRTVK